ncbi:ABC transporter related protein [Hydrogenobacter thermophilus TK-6]|uniref:ABC-type metal ion transport system ATPase component n=1 Tax=Hydrogenobacter thermophilus (strain DSM 6534 / IAM 12695 / TK-6) TaxID=608538 RepID=D3DFB2_HYDTT|nr:metal ABC transporter ATP-binding protein [Hydrogenobacter thermophilus]ADO44458.1 ABC transporter related protein [Hydrogenobacter thermophilus TK-6]BAI68514.1 ABC-type metal ion transport system ATPase component [Hydrogenobacter thermophilus TK-6]
MQVKEALKVKNLSFRYRRDEPLIDDLSFSVLEGEFFGILGPNGSGKTTLLRLILGFLKPLSGSIELFGEDVRTFKRWNKVGYVPQRFHVEKAFTGTVGELFRALAPKEKVGWIIAYLHLEDLLKKQFTKLSGGQQQKVLLALALTTNPDMILLDEPLTGLDIHAQEHIESILKEISRKRTVIVVSHDVGFVLRNADRILCLGMQECRLIKAQELEGMLKELYRLH